MLRRQADALRGRHALEAAARTVGTSSRRVIGLLAQTRTALAHAELAALRDGDSFDGGALARVLQGLRETVRRLRGEGDPGSAGT